MIMVCHSLINNTDTGLIISFCSNTNPSISFGTIGAAEAEI